MAAKTFGSKSELEFFIGGMGGQEFYLSAGFNGGGKGSGGDFYNKGAGGGGATDVRIKSGSSSTRILVAGGGGGSNTFQQSSYSQINATGVGGGLEGGKGTVCFGGSQSLKTDSSCTAGTLGQGAAGSSYGSGGGGGYYGGSGGKGQGQNGGGGSGFIDPSFTKVNGITPTTLDGTKSFPKATLFESGNETGHEGNGAIRITKLSPPRTFFQTIGRTFMQTFAPTPTKSPIPRYILELCFSLVKKSERDTCIAGGRKKYIISLTQILLVSLK